MLLDLGSDKLFNNVAYCSVGSKSTAKSGLKEGKTTGNIVGNGESFKTEQE